MICFLRPCFSKKKAKNFRAHQLLIDLQRKENILDGKTPKVPKSQIIYCGLTSEKWKTPLNSLENFQDRKTAKICHITFDFRFCSVLICTSG